MNQWWNDEPFIAELDKQSADLKSGRDKGVTWDELKRELLSSTIEVSKIKNDR